MVRDDLAPGYDEVALTCLSTADFSGVDAGRRLMKTSPRPRPGLALVSPSLRAYGLSEELLDEIQKVRRTGLTFAPEGRLVAAAPGHQQADRRGRPLLRGRRRVLAGLAAGEALLPHRAAHRDGRRHARHRGRSPSNVVDSRPASTRSRRAARCRSAGSCRSRTRRSSGSARTASTSCGARSALLATTATKGTQRAGEVARSRGDVRRRASRQPRRPADRARHRARLARGRHVPGVERALRARPLDSTRWPPRASTPTGTSPGTAPLDEVLPWDHIAAGLHKDFLWQDWQAALAEHGLPDCRWTPCYDCGVCTDYALEHVVASPVAARGRQPGHRPGPGRRGAGAADAPCASWAPARTERSAMRGDAGFPVRLRYTKRGKIRWISHRDVARAMERAFRITAAPARVHRGVLAPAEGELRARALDRARERRRVPRPRVPHEVDLRRLLVGVAQRRAARRHGGRRRGPARRAGAGACKKR